MRLRQFERVIFQQNNDNYNILVHLLFLFLSVDSVSTCVVRQAVASCHAVCPAWTDQWPSALHHQYKQSGQGPWGSFWMVSWQWNRRSQGWRPAASTSYVDWSIVRHSVGQELTAHLVHAFVLSRLDYGNSVLAGLLKSTIAPLQSVQYAAARLILGLQSRDHVTTALRQLHWLPGHQRIQHKLCTMWYFAYTVSASADNPTRPGRTSVGERAFSDLGPLAWNALSLTLRDIADRTRFRKLLKTHLSDSRP